MITMHEEKVSWRGHFLSVWTRTFKGCSLDIWHDEVTQLDSFTRGKVRKFACGMKPFDVMARMIRTSQLDHFFF